MSAFFIATSVIKDGSKFKEYGAAVGPTLAPFGGELVIKGMAQAALIGQATYDAVGVIRFPDMKNLTGWYQSKDYQALVGLREEAVDMTLITHVEPT